MQSDEYRKLAEVEDRMWYFHALHRRAAHWLDRLLPARPVRVLDAGCGTGGFIRRTQATHPGWELTGVDSSAQACELARERTPARIVQGSVLALPFAAGEFDAIVSLDVIGQVDDGGAVLREFARCLRPGGTLVINVAAYRWLWSYHDEAVQAKRRYTRKELGGSAVAAGFEVAFATYANLPTLPLAIVRRKLFPPRHHTSDVRLYPEPVEATLRVFARLEHAWINRGWPVPAGSSVFLVATRCSTPNLA